MRGEVRRVGDLTLLLDCYNANPQSVRAALDLLESRDAGEGGRVAVLGTMLELGGRSDELHRTVLADALGRELDVVVATGAFAAAVDALDDEERSTGESPVLVSTPEPEAAFGRLREHLRGDETVLLKGSRGVALEKLVPLFEEAYG